MITFAKVIISTILFIGGSFFIPGPAGAGDSGVQTPFNAGEIIERVSHHPRVEGDRIIIQDRAYEAEFREGKAVIKAKQEKPGAEDVVIPVSGRPKVRDGRVVYSSWEGEVEFEGHSRGLRFSERRAMLFGDSLVGRYSGNVARLIRRDTTINHEQSYKRTTVTPAGEFVLDTNVIYGPTLSVQEHAAVACDGSIYLIVWDDWRNNNGEAAVYGARVNPEGKVLDSLGFAISTSPSYMPYPEIDFDGTNFMVVWRDQRNGNDYDIYGARVSPSGIVLDPNGIAISTAPSVQQYCSIAFNGTNYLVAWMDFRNNNRDIYGARVTPGGILLDTAGIAISNHPADQLGAQIACDGTNFLVVWYDNRVGTNADIYGARVSPGGVVLDTAGIAISAYSDDQTSPYVAFGGMNYLVVWNDARNHSTTYYDIYGARMTPSGVVLDTNGIPISRAPDDQVGQRIAYDGNNYLVVWEDRRRGSYGEIYGARVSPGGLVIDPNGFLITSAALQAGGLSIAYDGANYLIVLQQYHDDDWDVYGVRVTPGGTILDPSGVLFSTYANTQRLSSVAFGGTCYLAVWEDFRKGGSIIYGIRLDPYGVVLDSTAIRISNAVNSQYNPSVAFDGSNFLVVWQDYRKNIYGEIYGARVSPFGVVLDPAGIAIADTIWDQLAPSVAFNGTNYLVAWEDSRRSSRDIFAARVSPGGVVLDHNGKPVSTAAGTKGYTSVASDGLDFLVVWDITSYDRNGNPYSSVHGARVDRNGVVLDTAGINIKTTSLGRATPSVSFDGSNYFVVWAANRAGTYDIYGARVNRSGVVSDTNGIVICAAANIQRFPTIAFDGTNSFVAWHDYRNGSWDIYGAEVDTGGAVVDTVAISLQSGDQINPVIAHGPGDQVLVTYSGFTDSIHNYPVKTTRIWGKFYPGPLGVSKEVGFPGIVKNVSLRVYPNPFREKAWVSANVPGRLKVYDALGRLVREFPKEAAKPGPLAWDGRDERGRRLPGGVYFLRFEHGTGCETRKAILIR